MRGRARWWASAVVWSERHHAPALARGTPASRTREQAPPAYSAFELLLQLIEKAPVGSLRDDLAGARLDDARLPQTQGPEPHRVLGFVLPPLEADLFDRLQDVLVLVRDALVDHQASCPLRLAHAEIG